MKNRQSIQVAKSISKLLNLRESATALFCVSIENGQEIIEFDFDGVEFMSRSFADQFHKECSRFLQRDSRVTIDISNANEEITYILKKVAETQNKTNREYKKLPIFRYTNTGMLSDYLMSV